MSVLGDYVHLWYPSYEKYGVNKYKQSGKPSLESVLVKQRQLNQDRIDSLPEINSSVLEELKTTVKIDITPKGSYDKYAREVSLENLAKTEQFMNTAWLEDYVSLLDNDAVMPKIKLEDLIKRRKAAQERIRQIQQQGSIMQQQVAQMMQTGEIMPKEMQQYMGNNQQPMEEGANVEY